MMFELFALVIIIGIVFFLAGFYFENYPTFMLSGVIFLILTGGVMASGLTMQTGEFIEEEHPCDLNETCMQQEFYNTTTTVTYIYSSSEGMGNTVLVSLLLAMTFFAFGCALIYATPEKDRDNNPDHIEYNFY